MNGAEAKISSGGMYWLQFFWDFLFQLILILVGVFFLVLIIILKSRSDANLSFEPILYIYSIFITAFQLSRLIAAMFYESSIKAFERGNLSLNGRRKFSQVAENGADNYFFEPTATFVIPCKNEEKVIANTVRTCFLAEYPKEKIEVIVVNDGSTDRTEEVLEELQKEFQGLKIINWKENRGKRHAMAEAMRRAGGEIIIQLDSDSHIEPKTFRKIVEPFQDETVGAVSAHTDPTNADQNFLTKMQAAYYFMSFRILKAAESTFTTVFCCSGCASAYRKSIILPVIDEWIGEKFLGLPATWGDDRALTSRVLKQGYKTIYSNRVQAHTIVPDNFRQLIKQQIRWKKSWFVNALYNSRFIVKKQPFVAFTYFFPLIGISFLSPIMSARALLYLPLFHRVLPLYHIGGVLLIAGLFAAYYRFVAKDNKYWIYLPVWALFNFFILSFLMFYALARLQDRRWGTR
jgi:hyaluronan synthase